jgi:Bacterial Ig-like domain/Putative flagellar system-associated repeat
MAITTRYTLLGSGGNFMDFYSPYGALALDGETIAFKGSSGIDQVYVGAATGLTFDFTQSGTGVDKVFLSGSWSDYTRTTAGSSLTLTRISGGSEVIKVNTGDNLIFANGYVTVADAISNTKGTLPGLTLNTGETTAAYPVTVAGPFNNTVRAVVQDPSGETIATTRPGVALIVKGGSGVDIVYVNAGTQVDASQLGGGTDKVYLMGNFDDYTGTVAGTNVTLTRTVGSDVEIVKILKGSVSANDTIVFADGTTTSIATFNYWSAPTTVPHPVLSSSELTPLPGPTVSITSSLNALHIGSSATITFTLSETSSDFTVADVTVSGATLSNFSGAGTTYTATLTPLAQSTTTATISVAGHTFIGSSGKSNTNSPTLSVPIDTVIDTPVVSLLNDTGVVNTDHITSSAALSLSTPAADVTRTFTVDGGQAELTYVAPTTTGNHTVVVTDTDTAGNSANASLTFTLDVGAPTISEQAAHSGTQTIELVYTENLDVLHLPSANAFTVTTGGAANAVTAVSVTGSVVTLTLANAFAPGVVTVAYNDPTAGNDTNALQDLAGNDASSFISGVLADGYVRGASVYIDTNGSGTVDAGDFYVGVTDAFGNFFIPSNAPTTGAIMAIGGFNTDTGVANTLPLKAPAGSTTINPLTTLVQAVIDASQGVTTAAEASATIATNLGLTIPQGQSLTSYDPIASGDLAAQKVAAQIATIVSLATTESSGSGAAVMSNIANEIQNAAPSTVVSLSDTTVLTNALNGVTTSVGLQSAIADASSAIGSATTLSAVSAVQSQYLDNVAPDAPTLAIAANTNDSTPQLTVTVNITDQAGHAAVAGDTIVVRDGAVQIASIVLDAAAAKAGQVVVSLPTLSEGLHNLTAVAVDQAGNASATSTNASVKVDTIAPNAPVINAIAGNDIVGFAEQASTITGTAEANTNLTLVLGSASHNVVVQANGIWSYTLDAADLTALGQGSANVSATASDAAGNVSATGSRAILVDTIAPIATASITGTTSPVVNNVTTDNTPGLQGTIAGQLAGNESVAIFVDGVRVGTAQVSGSTWSFTTGSLSSSNVLHTFAAQVEDSASNVGTMSADFSLTVNATVPSATVAFDSGTGYSTTATPALTGTVSGTLNGGDVVVISEGSTLLGQAVVTNGTWSFTPFGSLGEGAHTFTAVVESSGGNQGTATLSPVLTIDTVAPNLPAINAVTADNVINAAETGTQVTGTDRHD